jgi:hypothetical protein
VRLQHIRTDNDSAWSNHFNAIDPDSALIKAWRLRSGVTMDRSPPYTQALNPVERSTRRFNQLMYDNLRSQYLSAWPWAAMALAATQQLNYTSVPGASHKFLREMTRYEALRGHPPDASAWGAAPGSPCYVKIEGSSASSLQPTALVALYVCPNYHGPTSYVINLATMQLVATAHVWFPPPGPHRQWGSIMQSEHLSSDVGGALAGVLRGQDRGTRVMASELWAKADQSGGDVLFEMHPVTGGVQRILDPVAARGFRFVTALDSAGEEIAVEVQRDASGEYLMDQRLLPIGRFPAAPQRTHVGAATAPGAPEAPAAQLPQGGEANAPEAPAPTGGTFLQSTT